MSRTHRRLNPRTRAYLSAPSPDHQNPGQFLPEHPNQQRKTCLRLLGCDGLFPSEVHTDVNVDRYGSTKRNGWTLCWTNSRGQDRRYVAKKIRAAHKRLTANCLADHYQTLDLDYYDDEPMDYPDWYGLSDDYEYPEDRELHREHLYELARERLYADDDPDDRDLHDDPSDDLLDLEPDFYYHEGMRMYQ